MPGEHEVHPYVQPETLCRGMLHNLVFALFPV